MMDDGLLNGFMFSFDISMETSSAVRVAPITQPPNGQLSMAWTPSIEVSSGKGTSSWEFKDAASGDTSSINIQQTDRLAINYPVPSTFGFFYILSPDRTQYTLAAFQAGQFIAQNHWAKGEIIPSLGFTIQRLSGGASTVAISNVTTIPGYSRNIPSGSSSLTATASDSQASYPPTNVLDGNPATFWHSEYDLTLVGFPAHHNC